MTYKTLPDVARVVIFLGELIRLLIIVALNTGIYFMLSSFILPPIIYICFYIVAGLFLFFSLLSLILKPSIGFRYYRYAVTSDRISIRYGVFTRTEETLPMRRLQKVTVDSGPILRLFKLADINIYSAGGFITINKIAQNEADMLALELTQTINEMVEAGVASNV